MPLEWCIWLLAAWNPDPLNSILSCGKLNLVSPLQAKLINWVCSFGFSFLMYLLPVSCFGFFLLRLLCSLDCCPFSHFVFSILLIGGNEPSSGRNSPLPYRPDSRPLTPTYAQAPKHFHVPGRSWHVSVSVSCRSVECSLVTSSRLHLSRSFNWDAHSWQTLNCRIWCPGPLGRLFYEKCQMIQKIYIFSDFF